eukprot:GILI01020567.1.p1 GENE.GILI01020567.1~~GILI01020567.1.p1  ORF type:complete len:1091 (-),score=268.69 GILI01020567.1:85-2913(-)
MACNLSDKRLTLTALANHSTRLGLAYASNIYLIKRLQDGSQVVQLKYSDFDVKRRELPFEGLVGLSLKTGEAIIVKDPTRDSRFRANVDACWASASASSSVSNGTSSSDSHRAAAAPPSLEEQEDPNSTGWAPKRHRFLSTFFQVKSGQSVSTPSTIPPPNFDEKEEKKKRALKPLKVNDVKDMLLAPLKSSTGTVVGVLQLINKKQGKCFSTKDLDRLQLLILAGGVVVDTMLDYACLRSSLYRHRAVVSALMKFSSDVLPVNIIHSTSVCAKAFLETERCTVFLVDETRTELWSKITDSQNEIRLPISSGIVGHCARTGESAIIPDAYADPRFNPEFDRRSGFRTRNILCTPIRDSKGLVVGVLQAINKRKNKDFSAEEFNLLAVLTRQAGVSIEHFHTLEQANKMRVSLKTLVTSVNKVQILFDVNACARSVTGDTKTVFNLEEADILGKSVTEWCKDISLLTEFTNVLKRPCAKFLTDLEVRTVEGHRLSVDCNIVPVCDEGKVFGFLLILTNVVLKRGQIRAQTSVSHSKWDFVRAKLLPYVHRSAFIRYRSVPNGQPKSLTAVVVRVWGNSKTDSIMHSSERLHHFSSSIAEKIVKGGGWIDSYSGTQIVGLFGVPVHSNMEDSVRACDLALEVHTIFEKMCSDNLEFSHLYVTCSIAMAGGVNVNNPGDGSSTANQSVDVKYDLQQSILTRLARVMSKQANKFKVKTLLCPSTRNAIANTNKYVVREMDFIQVEQPGAFKDDEVDVSKYVARYNELKKTDIINSQQVKNPQASNLYGKILTQDVNTLLQNAADNAKEGIKRKLAGVFASLTEERRQREQKRLQRLKDLEDEDKFLVTSVHELIGAKAHETQSTPFLLENFSHGLALYRQAKYQDAFLAFEKANDALEDYASLLFMKRCTYLQRCKVPVQWDPSKHPWKDEWDDVLANINISFSRF